MINDFEDKLQKVISKNVEYQFIGWSNWNSHTEIIYYTTEPKLVAKELQNIITLKKEIPFAFRAVHDHQWNNIQIYFDFSYKKEVK